jgi:hypothetical protein
MTLFSIRGYRITASDEAASVSIATVSPKPQQENSPRIPMVEYCLQMWPLPQPYIHDCTVVYRGSRFRIFFRRHKRLPKNPSLNVNGDLIIMRLGQKNLEKVVNLRAGDTKLARQIARRQVFHPFTTFLELTP